MSGSVPWGIAGHSDEVYYEGSADTHEAFRPMTARARDDDGDDRLRVVPLLSATDMGLM